jgi:hypothetical protein
MSASACFDSASKGRSTNGFAGSCEAIANVGVYEQVFEWGSNPLMDLIMLNIFCFAEPNFPFISNMFGSIFHHPY